MTGAALGDRFGRRRVFVAGIAVFTLASVGCGLADTSAQLIAFRAVQGFGGGGRDAAVADPAVPAVPARRRGMAMGVWSGVSGLAVAMGPVVGGAVVDGLDWRWIFWINVPVCVIAIPLGAFALRESSLPAVRLDLVGMALAAAGLCAVVWAIVHGEPDGWTSAKVLGTFTAGAALLVGFVAWEARTEDPMLPLSFYRARSFTLTNIVIVRMRMVPRRRTLRPDFVATLSCGVEVVLRSAAHVLTATIESSPAVAATVASGSTGLAMLIGIIW